jgi:SAM-dependent methyltransferase
MVYAIVSVMKLKADWTTYIHRLKTEEIKRLFSDCPEDCFPRALELGAGEGFESTLLAKYAKHLVCVENNPKRLVRAPNQKISYQLRDAEKLDEYCEPSSFDLVFSSNLLEHLREKERTLRKIHTVLKDSGVCITIVPGTLLKLCWIFLFYPNLCLELLEVLSKPGGLRKVLHRTRGLVFCREFFSSETALPQNWNNPNSPPSSPLLQCLWPAIHGEYRSHLVEFLAYRRNSWKRLIEQQGFHVSGILKMPVVSGYGFGLDFVRHFLEKLGFTSSYAYVAFKRGMDNSPYRAFWKEHR